MTRIWSILMYVLCKECVYIECSINVDQILLVDVLLSFYRSLLIFSPVVLSVVERGMLKSPTLIVSLSIYPFSSVIVCYIYFALLFRAYKFRIVMTWWINPFFIM